MERGPEDGGGTRDARHGKIPRDGRVARGSWHDVIVVEGGFRLILRSTKGVATPARPILDPPAQPRGDIAHARPAADSRARSARSRSSDNSSARLTRPSASCRSAVVGRIGSAFRGPKAKENDLGKPEGDWLPHVSWSVLLPVDPQQLLGFGAKRGQLFS